MFKKLILPLAILSWAVLPSCNSSTVEEYEYTLATNVMVTSFSLQDDEKVLDSLHNVYFSIDLVNARIFNADSMPYGTKVNRLVPKIGTPSTVSAVTVEYPRVGQPDSVVDYLENSTDSIDFSLGPVKLRVTSQSGSVERVYLIDVNVHKIKPDTLAWKRMERMTLPGSLRNPQAQCAARCGDDFYCLTTRDGLYSVATTKDPYQGEWKESQPTFSFEPDVESLRATDNALYVLSADGDLYTSADFSAWTSAGVKMHSIYGAFGDDVIGSQKGDGGAWSIVAYPSGKTWVMPDGFPVSGTSLPASYSIPLGIEPQMVMLGGELADGTYTSAAWSFDGQSWVNVSIKPLPIQAKGVSMVAYDIFEVPNTTWTPKRLPALIAFGGITVDGVVNGKVYMSLDWGMTWREASKLMQLPSGMPWSYGSTMLVYSTTMHLQRSSTGWCELPIASLPPQCSWVYPQKQSRVTAPITEWECPAIYMFGGRTPDGRTQDSLWRGVILRYTFCPVY